MSPRRYATRALAIAGAGALLTSYPAYLLGALMASQVGWFRTAAAFAVGLALAVLAGLALAAAVRARPPAGRPAWLRLAELAFAAGVLANGAAIGLALWFRSAALAPAPYKAVAAGVVLALTANLARQGSDASAAFTRLLLGAGRLLAGAALAFLPVVAVAAALDAPTLPGRPELPAGAPRPDAPRRIVLVTFDGLRSRGTTLADPTSDTTPALARLAGRSIYFPNFRPAGDQTVVSLPAILTGIAPPRLYAGIRHRAGSLREGSVRSVAAYLRAAGYRTHFETMLVRPGTFSLDADFDAGRPTASFLGPATFNTRAFLPLGPAVDWARMKAGWAPAAAAPEERDVLQATRRALDRARAALEAGGDRIFVWVHLGLPHAPFIDVPKAALGPELRVRAYPKVHPLANRPDLFPTYERAMGNYLRFGDHELGRFLAALEASPAWPRTLLAVTSDHGVELIPGKDIHGNGLLTEDVAHVPLLLHEPGRTAPARDPAPAGHVDLVPTILAAVYGDVPAGFDGTPLLGRRASPRTTAFVWGLFGRQVQGFDRPANVAAYADRHKYVLTLPARQEALFDLAADPAATRDVAAARPAVLADLRARTAAYLAGAGHQPRAAAVLE